MKKLNKDIEKVPVFGLSHDPITDVVTLIVGIPTKSWSWMQNGKTSTIDLTKAGVRMRVVLFGGPTHQVVYDTLVKHNAKQGMVSDNQLNKDFGIDETGMEQPS